MSRVRLSRDEEGIAAVVGAIVLLAVLGIAVLYVNAFHVPRQGESLEVAAAERTDAALLTLASRLAAPAEGPISQEFQLRAEPAAPPLMAGVVLTPARHEGSLALDASSSNVTISILVPAPAGGVPGGDPTRVAEAGKMRVYLLGNATAGQPMGALRVTTGGAYLAATERVLEGGALITDTAAGSANIAPPSLTVASNSGRASVTWRLPLLAGAAAEVASGASGSLTLVPGPEAALGGGQNVDELRIRVDTPRFGAWNTSMRALVGTFGAVTTSGGAADAGSVTATIPNAKLDLFLVRYEVSLAERAG